MADRIIAPINYSVIANGKFVSGGSVVFGVANVKPDINNPATLKAIYTDANLLIEAQNPQPLDSNGVFDQTANGVLYGVDSDTYSVVVFDSNGAELSYMPIYDLSDANAAITAQQAAADAEAAETGALNAQTAAEQSESNTLALYTDFVNRYFGAFSSDPTVDDVGNPPDEGSLYWNTVSNRFKVYDSGVWIFPEDLGLGTAAYKDVQTSPSDATPEAVLNNETTHIGGEINFTGANYQPNDSLGIGVVRYMQNNSGATHSNGQTGIAGSALNICFGVGSSGLWASSGVSVVGTWTQVAGNTVGDQNYGLYVRTA